MSQPENDSQVAIGAERRRREAAVRIGRQHVLLMENERKLDSYQRKIQELLRRNHGLGSLLAEIEKENEEQQQEAEMEVARRQKVVKLWRLQAKMMKRERRLEKQMGIALEKGSLCRELQDRFEIMNQFLEDPQSEEELGRIEDMNVKASPPVLADLLPIEKQIQEEEEEAQTLR